MFKVTSLTLSFANLIAADLRMASQPQSQWRVQQQQGSVRFVSSTALYMEPSDFGYQGLKNQRANNYDNFLRSNIDNEQDNRNFNTEDGRDHLPFRSFEGASTDVDTSVQTKIPTTVPGPSITAAPGEPYLVPLRWNNPHSSELEVNIWIVENQYVVPIRKPTCAGEGYKDAVFSFTVPKDFNSLGSKVPGFAGCTKVGDCVLQIYAHSVETRMYAMGTPLVVTGYDPAVHKATATDESLILPAPQDPGLDLSKLRDLCLPSNDPAANIASAQPQMARYISDVYNHAYQNSDYSPYSGQQPQLISKNLQAASILKMVSGNRGELGKQALNQDNPRAARFQNQLDRKVDETIRYYERLTNTFINAIGERMKSNDTLVDGQRTEVCFRCGVVGSTTKNRETTTTYIPSFSIAPHIVPGVMAIFGEEYGQLISENGLVQIYVSALRDMGPDFVKAAMLGLHYQPPVIKSSIETMQDATLFKKIDFRGTQDGGLYAAREAAKLRPPVAQTFRAAPVAGVRFVRIVQPQEFLQVAYVEVLTPTGANVALKKNVTASPGFNRDGRLSAAPGATVLGNPGIRSFPNIYHSNSERDSWWEVDLARDTNVSMVTYYNRGDCCQNRAEKATVQLLDANRQVIHSSQLNGDLVQQVAFGPPRIALVQLSSLLEVDEAEAQALHQAHQAQLSLLQAHANQEDEEAHEQSHDHLEVDGEGRLRAERVHQHRAVRPWAGKLASQRATSAA